ncbi:MAG: hypothetical protein K2H20_02085 [Bacilli bacterium]|nr:hypothetical protein [Bacilli bacterium]
MKKNSFIIALFSIIVLSVFTVVSVHNIKMLDKEKEEEKDEIVDISGIHYIDEENVGKIESWNIENNKLLIKTSGEVTQFCVKSTKSEPTDKDICWKEIKEDKGTSTIYHNKRYYVWIRDEYGILGESIIIDNN